MDHSLLFFQLCDLLRLLLSCFHEVDAVFLDVGLHWALPPGTCEETVDCIKYPILNYDSELDAKTNMIDRVVGSLTFWCSSI